MLIVHFAVVFLRYCIRGYNVVKHFNGKKDIYCCKELRNITSVAAILFITTRYSDRQSLHGEKVICILCKGTLFANCMQ